jgi:hypothetical protein
LDEEKSTDAGFAQEIGFSPMLVLLRKLVFLLCWFCSGNWFFSYTGFAQEISFSPMLVLLRKLVFLLHIFSLC